MSYALSAENAGRGSVRSLRDVAVEVFYYQRLILTCLGAGLAIGLGGLILARTEYTAQSQVLIRAAAESAPREGLNGPALPLAGDAVQRLIQTDIETVQSDPVLSATLIGTRSPAGPGEIEALRRRVQVSADPNASLIRIALRDTDRARGLRTLRALLQAYTARRGALYRGGPLDRQTALISQNAAEIARLTEAISKVRMRAGVLDIAQAIQLAGADLDALDQRLGQAHERRASAFAERAAAAAGLTHTPLQVFDHREVTNTSPNDEGRNTLLRLRQDRAHMASQYAPDWPGLLELDRKIAAAEAEIAANARDFRAAEHTARNPLFDQLTARQATLGLDLAAVDRQIAVLERERLDVFRRIGELQTAESELHALEQRRSVAEGIQHQLAVNQAARELAETAMGDGEATVRIVQPPSAPLKGKNLGATYLLAGLLAGAASALALTCCASVLRQRYITAQAAERALGLPALAETEACGPNVGLGRDARPIAGLATLLTDVRVEGRPLGIVQILGTEAATKAALALSLGRALAGREGQAILIVDLDSEDRYLGLAPPGTGRELALPRGRLGLARSVVPGLWIATRIKDTPLAALDASADAAKACADVLRQSFRLVLLVAPANFAAYPARRLCSLADANLLVIDAARTRAPTARRLRDVVLAAGGDLLGFVFTSRRRFIPEPVLKWL